MPPTSPSKVKVTRLTQVAIACRDLQATALNYWKLLGIGPWDIYDWEYPRVTERTYHGKKSWAREKIALVQVGDVELELVQPVEGDSIYQDFIDKHGEGIHHLQFKDEKVEEVAATMEAQGFPCIQGGRFGDKGRYYYMDTTQALGAIWEPIREAGDKATGVVKFPADGSKSPSRYKVNKLTQVAIAVWDLQAGVEKYWKLLGIGPWDVYDWEYPRVTERTYMGKKSWAREKIALVQLGGIELELVQPVEGDSIYLDFLEKHGEGLHHLQFKDEKIDEVAATLEDQGFPCVQGGHFGNIGRYYYMDTTQPLKTIWEPVREATDKTTGIVKFPA
jgi:catechol 2,3-dioxygenase-like lactoylglutathione lyase family enzyme